MAANASVETKNWRILCIDDDPDILFILENSLGIAHEVITAHDGMEAVALLDTCDADFVICDVRMPEMDGFQTVEAIRSHPDYGQTPVFFLTAETDKEMARRGFAAGANLYLTKPFDPMRLLKNIDYFLKENGQQPRQKRLNVEMAVRMARDIRTKDAGVPDIGQIAVPAATAKGKPRAIILCANRGQLDRLNSAISKNYESIPCTDALASLQRLFRYEPDLLVINPIMPKVSGWGLAQMIRRNPRLNDMPMVLVDDVQEKVEPRVVSTITKHPLIPATASASDIMAVVDTVAKSPDFVVHPKRSALADLLREEETLRIQMEQEQQRLLRQEASRRERYQKIQQYIDSHR